MINSEQMTRGEFWQRAAAISFSLWTVVLGVLAWMAAQTIGNFNIQMREIQLTLQQIDRRLLIVEERQHRVMERLGTELRKD